MAQEFAWSLDAPSGTFKNHALSEKVREAAIARTKFLQFVDPEPNYGRKKGDTITISRVKNIAEPGSGQFNERDRVPVDTFAMSTVSITVAYFGRAIEYTEQSELLSYFDLKDKIQKKLRAQMALVLDTAAAAAFKTAKITFSPTSVATGTFETSGTPTVQALVNLSVSHLQVIRDYMMDQIHVPGYGGGEDYYCLAETKACRGLKRDPDFIEAHKYTSSDYLVKGEIGKVENIHIIEVNHTQALSATKGSGSVLGEALVFGDDAVTMAVVEDPELRAAIPGNFGLQHAVAWIGLLQFGAVWDTANDGEARIIRVTSS